MYLLQDVVHILIKHAKFEHHKYFSQSLNSSCLTNYFSYLYVKWENSIIYKF